MKTDFFVDIYLNTMVQKKAPEKCTFTDNALKTMGIKISKI